MEIKNRNSFDRDLVWITLGISLNFDSKNRRISGL